MKIRVYYEDTDMGGVVYHSNYLNYCERARSNIFFQKGLSPVLPQSHFVVKFLEANYIASAKLGDILEVKTEVCKIKAASFVLLQTIYKEEKKIFSMTITLAHISFEGKLLKITQDIKDLLENN